MEKSDCWIKTRFDDLNANLTFQDGVSVIQNCIYGMRRVSSSAFIASEGVSLPECVDAIAVVCIGKEANRWEEQYYLGLSLDAQIVYGMEPLDPKLVKLALQSALEESTLGQRELAKRADLSRTTVAELLAGKPIGAGYL
jgi:hypothetical protein